MKKFTKPITKIIVHCTATPRGRDDRLAEISRYHLQRGFETIGYHYLVYLDGTVAAGRPGTFVGAHCIGQNDCSIGVAYVGGIEPDGRTADTRTPAQRQALSNLVRQLRLRYPGATVHGHNEFAAKTCPCFNVKSEF